MTRGWMSWCGGQGKLDFILLVILPVESDDFVLMAAQCLELIKSTLNVIIPESLIQTQTSLRLNTPIDNFTCLPCSSTCS